MSKTAGWLMEQPSKDTGELGYMGEIEIAYFSGEVALSPVTNKRTERSPDFRVMFKTRLGWREYGAAWEKEPRAGGDTYMTLTLDHETFEKPVYVQAFPPSEDGDAGRWRIIWSRAKRAPVSAAPAVGAPANVDQIPY